MPAITRPSILRKVLEDQLSVLAGELASLHEQELASREAEQRESLRSELAESLNQAVRLLRQAEDFPRMASVIVDASSSYCKLLAAFSADNDRVRAERARGLSTEAADQFASFDIPQEQAAAFNTALQSGDPVVAMTTPREISAPLVQILGHKPEDRAFIVPVLVHGKPVGLIYAAGGVEMAPLEVLAQTAALALEAHARKEPSAPQRKPELVVIQGAAVSPAPTPDRKVPSSWSELSPGDQELHLRAQRFARVQVAGMRLFSPDLVKQGRDTKNIYAALQNDLDNGRDSFRKTFISASPTMVDYFHLEVLRTLANEDASLLGAGYPGPLV